jgi:DNA-binding beta-propeller fold protein YncE
MNRWILLVIALALAVWVAFGLHAFQRSRLTAQDLARELARRSRPLAPESPAGLSWVNTDYPLTLEFHHAAKGTRHEGAVGAAEAAPNGFLASPAKVSAQAAPAFLFITDTGHNRIVACLPDGQVTALIGSGEAGLRDGDFAQARFQTPRGSAARNGILYVADTGNHVIRRVDMARETVTTVAGTGGRGTEKQGGPTLRTPLDSPWDVALSPDGKTLYIAMAGDHAIWMLDLERETVERLAGTSREGLVDGGLREAAFVHPSGLALAGDTLYVADSGSSAIRALDLRERRVRTLVGAEQLVPGDRMGTGVKPRPSQDLAVALLEGKLLVADSSNHELKVLDPRTRQLDTFLGDGEPGAEDGSQPHFREPSGLALLSGKLFVADMGDHSVHVVDLADKTVTTLELRMPERRP